MRTRNELITAMRITPAELRCKRAGGGRTTARAAAKAAGVEGLLENFGTVEIDGCDRPPGETDLSVALAKAPIQEGFKAYF